MRTVGALHHWLNVRGMGKTTLRKWPPPSGPAPQAEQAEERLAGGRTGTAAVIDPWLTGWHAPIGGAAQVWCCATPIVTDRWSGA